MFCLLKKQKFNLANIILEKMIDISTTTSKEDKKKEVPLPFASIIAKILEHFNSITNLGKGDELTPKKFKSSSLKRMGLELLNGKWVAKSRKKRKREEEEVEEAEEETEAEKEAETEEEDEERTPSPPGSPQELPRSLPKSSKKKAASSGDLGEIMNFLQDFEERMSTRMDQFEGRVVDKLFDFEYELFHFRAKFTLLQRKIRNIEIGPLKGISNPHGEKGESSKQPAEGEEGQTEKNGKEHVHDSFVTKERGEVFGFEGFEGDATSIHWFFTRFIYG